MTYHRLIQYLITELSALKVLNKKIKELFQSKCIYYKIKMLTIKYSNNLTVCITQKAFVIISMSINVTKNN